MFKKWLKRILWGVAWFVAGLAVLGGCYQAFTSWRDAGKFQPPGRLVAISGGRKLHLDCRGAGSPTVLIETGLGSPALHWIPTLEALKATTRVCTYDRAGYGYSDGGNGEARTTSRIVDELEQLLATAGEKPPFVLVGHSFGGFNVRVFAARHRDQTAAMVLVDSSHPEQKQRFPEEVARQQRMIDHVLVVLPVLNFFGVVRAGSEYAGGDSPSKAEMGYLQSRPKFVATILSEMQSFDESARETIAAGTSFGDLPLLVLTAGKDGVTPPALRKVWLEQLQPELVRMSTRGRQKVVNDATHMMMVDDLAAVVDGIKEMVAEVRR